MSCCVRTPFTMKRILRLIKRGDFRYLIEERKLIIQDLIMPNVCKYFGHKPYYVREEDPNCNAVACRRCGRFLDR